jgi:integrase
MATLAKTSRQGIFRSHRKSCPQQGKCPCNYVVFTYYRGKQVKTTCSSLEEAKAIKGGAASGRPQRPSARTRVDAYFAKWIKSYTGRTTAGFSDSSREEYDRAIRKHVLPRMGHMKLGEVEAADFRELYQALRDAGASTSEIKKTRAGSSAMFATAVEDRLVPANPVLNVRIPPAPLEEEVAEEEDAKALTREELGLVLAAVPGEWRLFFELLAHTGLRIGEAIALNWEHLDLSATEPEVKVREQIRRGRRKRLKTKAARRDLPLSPGMRDALLAHRNRTYLEEKAPVFSSPGSLRKTEAGLPFPLSPQNFARNVLHPARKALGMEWVTFHSFRHTTASLLFAEGKNLKQVSEWLGHSDPSFTLRRYVHLMDGRLGDASFLDTAVRPAGYNGGNAGAIQGAQTAESPVPLSTRETAS